MPIGRHPNDHWERRRHLQAQALVLSAEERRRLLLRIDASLARLEGDVTAHGFRSAA
jgi:hypothetical protein